MTDVTKGAYHESYVSAKYFFCSCNSSYFLLALCLKWNEYSVAEIWSGCFLSESAIRPSPPSQHVIVGAPGNSPTPPLSPPSSTTPNVDVQSMLLSLLGQAAQVTGQIPTNR